jgi:hypothetical protein
MAATVVGNWWRDFGDNDALGWTITLAYFLAAALCFRTARRIRRDRAPGKPGGLAPPEPPRVDTTSKARDWVVIGIGMALLGLNKQLDLQVLARDTGLALVGAAGFDPKRRWVGRLFVFVLSVTVLSVLARSARHLRAARRGHGLTLLGLAFLACFVILRSAGYLPFLHNFNVRFKDVLHVVFELGGVTLVGLSAWRASPRRPPPQLQHE